ncbi:MAG: alpha/beta hydrolase family protein [Actinomycetota bacterium]
MLTEISIFLMTAFMMLAPMLGNAQEKTGAAPATPNIAGDWQGTLDTGVGKLHVILHVTRAADGNLKATLDSVDQNALGIPISSIAVTQSRLVFACDAVNGKYEGTISGDGSAIDGTWTQGKPLALVFKRRVPPSDIDGTWLGTLNAGGMKLRVAFHITNTPQGLAATLDSLDQGANGIPVSSIVHNGSQLRMEVKKIAGNFVGTVNKDLQSIDGTWTQGGGSLPLLLRKTKASAAELAPKIRPQDPVKPYPYREEEVSYKNNSAPGVTLAATLTLPQGPGPFPAVVLITGSGPQNRNEEVFGHRPFLVLADYLTRHGIAVLRADDRGIGKSTSDFASATTVDFATDAEAGIAYLKTRPEINQKKIGLIGHSEGGVIAPMVAARNHDVAFIVMMAGTGVPGDEVLAEQARLIEIANGAPAERAQKDADREREVLHLVKQTSDTSALESELKEKLGNRMNEAQIGAVVKQFSSPWFHYFLSYDPGTALRKTTCPALVLNGEKDVQVSAAQNLPAIRKALEQAGNTHFEVDELAGLNHLFQTAKTGSPREYSQIDETIAPLALKKIADWIAKQ